MESYRCTGSVAVDQSLSCVQLFVTPLDCSMHQAPLSLTISWSLLRLMSIESLMPSNHPLLPPLLLPLIFPSFRVFSNESALCTTRPKYWSQSIGFGRGLFFDLASLTQHGYFEIHPYYCIYLIVLFFPTSEQYSIV